MSNISGTDSKDRIEDQNGNLSSDSNRWNPDILNEFECKNVYLDEEEDNLPEFFDVDKVVKSKRDECSLCHEGFNMLLKKRNYCKRCGGSVCELCSQTSRKLSKSDKREYRVCDVCDHQMSNSNFKEKLAEEVRRKKDMAA